MKKKVVLSLSIFATVLQETNAQVPSSIIEIQKVWHEKTANSLLSSQVVFENELNKPTGIKQRVMAQSRKGSSGSDTTAYKYSGTRGSLYNFNNYNDMGYSKHFYDFDNVFAGSTTNDVLADTIIRSLQSGNHDYSVAQVREDRRLDFFFDYSNFNGSVSINKSEFFNDMQGRTYQYIRSEWYNSMPAFDTTNITFYTYDGVSTNLIADSTAFLYNVGDYLARRYHYNTQNKIDSIYQQYYLPPYIATGITYMQYSSQGQLTKMVSELYKNGVITQRLSEDFGYDGASSIFNLCERQTTDYDQGNIVSQDSARLVRFIENDLIDSAQRQHYEDETWKTGFTYNYYYNSYNNPDSVIGNSNLFPLTDRFYFYYETYDDNPPVSINEMQEFKELDLYPNPFNDRLTINWKELENSLEQVSLINVLGQIVYSADQNLGKGQNVITLPKLPDGYYTLFIKSSKGNYYEKVVVKK